MTAPAAHDDVPTVLHLVHHHVRNHHVNSSSDPLHQQVAADSGPAPRSPRSVASHGGGLRHCGTSPWVTTSTAPSSGWCFLMDWEGNGRLSGRKDERQGGGKMKGKGGGVSQWSQRSRDDKHGRGKAAGRVETRGARRQS